MMTIAHDDTEAMPEKPMLSGVTITRLRAERDAYKRQAHFLAEENEELKEKMKTLDFDLKHKNARLPTRAYETDAGLDIYAVEPAELRPGVHAVLPTGLHPAIPVGYAGIVKPRSGLAVRHSLDVLAGVIDSSFRGEMKVTLINHGDKIMEIKAGDRIAQLLIIPVALPVAVENKIDKTERGSGGFGSTGV